MRLKLIAVVAALASGPSVTAQDLPQAVTDAYTEYTAALDAGEAEAARDAAGRAFEAGEEAGIDANTLAVLAQNYALVTERVGDASAAADLFARSARLYESSGEAALTVAQVDRLGIEARFRAGDAASAAARADDVADALERMEASPARDFELARLRGVQAHAAWQDGRSQTAGQRGREAFVALQASGEPLTSDAAFLAYYSGIERAFASRHDDAAFWFAIATQMFDTHEVADNAATVAEAWGLYARGRLDDSERRGLLERLAEGGWVAEACGAECDGAESDDLDSLEDEHNRDAQPLRRQPPGYPGRMAAGGIQGIALMRFDVDPRGRAQNVEVVFSAPHPDFGEAGQRAVRNWRYLPKLVDGEPVLREDVVTQFVFQLDQ